MIRIQDLLHHLGVLARMDGDRGCSCVRMRVESDSLGDVVAQDILASVEWSKDDQQEFLLVAGFGANSSLRNSYTPSAICHCKA